MTLNALECKAPDMFILLICQEHYGNSSILNKHLGRLGNFHDFRRRIHWRVVLKEGGVYKVLSFLISRKWKIFNDLNNFFYCYIWILYKKQKKQKGVIKGRLNSTILKHFKINLRWSEGQKLNYTEMRWLIKFFYI